jgi:hypothetical protein
MMKIKIKSGATIVESMVVMIIIVLWVTWMYSIFNKSQEITTNTSNRLVAIAIAREWIEAVTNIRDTNWLLFSVNTENCWLVKDYNSDCITNSSIYIASWSYVLYTNTNNRWYLSWGTTWVFSSGAYQNAFRVKKDGNGLYTQSGWTDFMPLYTREIKISYPWALNPPQNVKIESIVRWVDNSRTSGNFEIILQTELTNWKNN